MWNIFIAIFSFALAFAFISSPTGLTSEILGRAGEPGVHDQILKLSAPISLFIGYLLSLAFFGLFQAIFMANAGGSWDNAKKIIEVDMKEKGTPLHAAAVVGDTVGDPYKDTSSVALNPVIKFTTLFGLLAMEIAIAEQFREVAPYIGVAFLLVALYFVYRSFYKMRIAQ
jgi:K(+)-stimulated pyrophosphate-energized sodium pump